jgi:putative tributyrin esterase
MKRLILQITALTVMVALAACVVGSAGAADAVTAARTKAKKTAKPVAEIKEVKVKPVPEKTEATKAEKKVIETMPEGCVREKFTVPSPSMKRDIRVAVVLPPEYAKNPEATYPVIYALHGMGAPYTTYTDMSPLRKFMVDHPMILVCFDADRASCYVDATQKPESQFTTFFFDELLPYIAKNYRTNGQRAVTGFSMGGYGAMHYLLARPEAFVSAGAQSGAFYIFAPPKPGSEARRNELLGPYKGNEAEYAKVALFSRIRARVADGKNLPPVQIRCGAEDYLLSANRDFLNLLIKQNVEIKKRIQPLLKGIDKKDIRKKFGVLRKKMMFDFEYTESPGAHNWPYWVGQSRAIAEFHWRHFQADARVKARTD